MIINIESKGYYIEECKLQGERKADERVPAQHNTIQLSKDRWFIIYETRGFRGVDDNLSVIYQVRKDAPYGPVLAEGHLDETSNNWDPLGDGRSFVKQCNHSVAFGVPKGALVNDKPAPHAGVFAASWANHARALDHDGYLAHRQEIPIPSEASRCVWLQFRLNENEDDIEIIQPKSFLRQKGFEVGETFCSHTEATCMNQCFVAPVPLVKDSSEWVHMMHWGGVVTPARYQWNSDSALYEWQETGPKYHAPEGYSGIGEASIASYNEEWLISARIASETYGTAWFRTDDPFACTPEPFFSDQVPSNCPRTMYRFPDGVIRVMTTDQKNSPYQDIHQRRVPLNILDVDPDSDFAVTKTEVVFDSLKEGIPISKENAPTQHFCRLVPHSGGRTGYLTFFLRPRALKTREYTIGNYKGIVKPGEIEASGVYYCEITYDRDYPPAWRFE